MRIKGILEYKGTAYNGFASQINAVAIQDVIEQVLSLILNEKIKIYASGRTDAGVHAIGQVIHFDTTSLYDVSRILHSTNQMLPNDIRFKGMEVIDDNFHARYSAKGKKYLYRFSLGEIDVFNYDLCTVVSSKFDIDLFKETLSYFVGKHDFKNFTSKDEDEANFIRTIKDIKVDKKDNIYEIVLEGDGFMRYMVRDIIGSAFAVATSSVSLSKVISHLDNENRDILPYKADAKGLFLLEVIY